MEPWAETDNLLSHVSLVDFFLFCFTLFRSITALSRTCFCESMPPLLFWNFHFSGELEFWGCCRLLFFLDLTSFLLPFLLHLSLPFPSFLCFPSFFSHSLFFGLKDLIRTTCQLTSLPYFDGTISIYSQHLSVSSASIFSDVIKHTDPNLPKTATTTYLLAQHKLYT